MTSVVSLSLIIHRVITSINDDDTRRTAYTLELEGLHCAFYVNIARYRHFGQPWLVIVNK